MVCSVLLVQVDRSRAPTLNTSPTGSSKRKARVLHKHPSLDLSMRIPKRVSTGLETAALNFNVGRLGLQTQADPSIRPAPQNQDTGWPAPLDGHRSNLRTHHRIGTRRADTLGAAFQQASCH